MSKESDLSSIDMFIGRSVKQLIKLIQKSTEVSKKERKILAILLEYPETSCFVKNYLKLNKQLSRKKEKAGLFGLERIAKAIQLSEKGKENEKDKRLSRLFR